MAAVLRMLPRVLRTARLNLARSVATAPPPLEQAVVLGVHSEEGSDGFSLSARAEAYDKQLDGSITRLLKLKESLEALGPEVKHLRVEIEKSQIQRDEFEQQTLLDSLEIKGVSEAAGDLGRVVLGFASSLQCAIEPADIKRVSRLPTGKPTKSVKVTFCSKEKRDEFLTSAKARRPLMAKGLRLSDDDTHIFVKMSRVPPAAAAATAAPQPRARPPAQRFAALAGLGGSLEDKNSDYLCPVCFDLIEEAYVTRCGHTFCYACIEKSVDLHRRCPKCGSALASRDHIFPNLLLNELIAKRKLRPDVSSPSREGAAASAGSEGLKSFVAAESQNLSMPDVDVMLEILTRRKRLLETESCAAQNRLLYDFLSHLYRTKSQQREQLAREADLVKKDMEEVEAVLRDVRAKCPTIHDLPDVGGDEAQAIRQEMETLLDTIDTNTQNPTAPSDPPDSEADASFAGSAKPAGDALAQRWRRMHAHFDDFVQCYFACRSEELYFGSSSDTGERVPQASDAEASTASTNSAADQRTPQVERSKGLDAFREDLVAFSRYRAFRPLATLSYSSDAINYSTIVSTIEFDKDNEYFAIAGVTKRIKVFEYESVVRDAVDVHYPCVEMSSSHKISCVSWNSYHKNVLASSDYEGTITVWDAATGQRSRAYQEHDKRCWSVHFNRANVRLLASGSDDARVKLWSLNAEHSVATLEAKFNVCCVRFNPRSSCHLAFGSADHCVHYYDLRSPRSPLCVFRDHNKAVSYVKFLDAYTLVSASTDSQLKLWNVESTRCVRSFTGHTNEKNFVGLATDGQYIACGSENNALYVYYKGLSRHLLAYRFDAVRGFLDHERKDDEQNEFVSAVCWKQNSNVLVAANSQGTIKVLELI